MSLKIMAYLTLNVVAFAVGMALIDLILKTV